MPRRTDIKRILIIGSGPIVIGQACEFDYSGTQACKALVADGFEVVLVNSNPATIMTDPETATRTYIEPLTVEFVAEIIKRERPDALLPTVGGQTGLNLSVELSNSGTLSRFGVELIGAKLEAIKVAEDRRLFRAAMEQIGLQVPRSGFANSRKEGEALLEEIGLPAVIRPSYTLGGTGGGIAFNLEEFREVVDRGLQLSPIHELLIEESVLGWKEFELEVMRDLNDNVVIICSIENFDPMGVHTGDSITVAPAQTLTDREYQQLRDMAKKIIRKVGVETGGSNIQFAVNPEDGTVVIIEMNPRVSRSSALASKATGFPIAKIAAKLAVGYLLNEIPNDITLKTPASFEPTLDYVVVKIPRWNFEKFPETPPFLGTQMKSVGEVMAIGRTFKEALSKGIRSLETDKTLASEPVDPSRIRENLIQPTPSRLAYIRLAFLEGFDPDEVYRLTGIDPWFLDSFQQIVAQESELENKKLDEVSDEVLLQAKKYGLSDQRLAEMLIGDGEGELTDEDIRAWRLEKGIGPVFKRPNRIGQGIEFDYCCCHAAFALKEAGFQTIMVNCNPETVSTDYDTSDRLYFEPLTFEDVMAIGDLEKPDGVIVQFGGQTPLKLALKLFRAGVPIIGTSPESIDLAEDRRRFGKLLEELSIRQPDYGTAVSVKGAAEIATRIGSPVLVRPSYVLGGRAMAIIYDDGSLEKYVATAARATPGRSLLIDRFLEEAQEFDVDALCDGEKVVIGGIMEHIEEAGIHSGDSTSVLPPFAIDAEHLEEMRRITRELALALRVVGLMNVQFAVAGNEVYVLEVNPRASRTVPFVSKATGVPLAKIAARLMIGHRLEDLGFSEDLEVKHCFIKAPVFPFAKFPGVDTILGPEMRSTGEVMGVAETFGDAYAKAQLSAGVTLPKGGVAFISVNERDKRSISSLANEFRELGFDLVATSGTAQRLRDEGLDVDSVYKVNEGRPNIVDLIRSERVDLVVNTPLGKESFFDEKAIRRACIQYGTPCITTLSAAAAAVRAIEALQRGHVQVLSMQEYHSI